MFGTFVVVMVGLTGCFCLLFWIVCFWLAGFDCVGYWNYLRVVWCTYFGFGFESCSCGCLCVGVFRIFWLIVCDFGF